MLYSLKSPNSWHSLLSECSPWCLRTILNVSYSYSQWTGPKSTEMNTGGYCDVCVSLRQRSYKQRWTNPRCQITLVITFCMVEPNIFITIIRAVYLANKCMYWIMCTAQKVPENSEVHKSLQNCGSLAQNLLNVNLLVPRIWRWIPDFWKICELLSISADFTNNMVYEAFN